jgi:membrane-associated phospholipid phosphatase
MASRQSFNSEERPDSLKVGYEAFKNHGIDDSIHPSVPLQERHVLIHEEARGSQGGSSPLYAEDTTNDAAKALTQDEERDSFGNHLRQCFSLTVFDVYTKDLRLELACSIFFGLLGHFLLRFIVSMPITQRDVQYQVTQNGLDTILNLTYNNSLIARASQTIPTRLLYLIGLIVPCTFVAVGSVLYGWSTKRHWKLFQDDLWQWSSPATTLLDGHSAICMLLIANGSNSFFTEFIKRYVGYFRPNFYQMCEFDMENGNNECLVDEQDGRKSFPSGHASLSFCGMLCLGLYLTGKVGLFHQWQPHRLRSFLSGNISTSLATPIRKKFLALACLGVPLMLATFVAASRVHDNYHHPADVITGAVIGSSCAWISYHLWCVLSILWPAC